MATPGGRSSDSEPEQCTAHADAEGQKQIHAAQHGNAVITVDANNTITLAGLSKAAATDHPSDFHLV